MRIRNLLAAALVATLLPSPSSALPEVLSDADVRALASSLPQGPAFRSAGQTYRPVSGLRAAVRGQATAVQRMQSLGAAAVDVVQEKGPYVIFRDAAAGAKALGAPAGNDPRAAFSVVVNTRTGRLGIADGLVTAKLADVKLARGLADAHGLALEFVAEGIRYAFFRVPPGGDLVEAAAALARSRGVVSAEVDVREEFAVPM
jgi:hypothetical protein